MLEKSKYQWLLFDADGTLFDFHKAEMAALVQSFSQHNLPFQPPIQKRYKAINHEFWARFEQKQVSVDELRGGRFRQLFTEFGIDFDGDAFADSYISQLALQAPLLAGARELLDCVNGRYQLALITNGLADVQYSRLEISNLTRYFSPIIVSDEIGVAKPDPGIFDEAFRQMGQPNKEDVLIIGDSLTSDIVGGINYGIDTCWYNPNGRQADPTMLITHEIKQLSTLTTII